MKFFCARCDVHGFEVFELWVPLVLFAWFPPTALLFLMFLIGVLINCFIGFKSAFSREQRLLTYLLTYRVSSGTLYSTVAELTHNNLHVILSYGTTILLIIVFSALHRYRLVFTSQRNPCMQFLYDRYNVILTAASASQRTNPSLWRKLITISF